MQNIFKNGLLILVMVAGPSLLAAENKSEETDPEPPVLQQRGQLTGELTLSVEDHQIAATLSSGRLGIPYGKVLILHDSNGGIDSPGLVRTLRQGLADAGWTTMTVALHYPQEPSIYLATEAVSSVVADEATSNADATMPEDAPASDSSNGPVPDNASRVLTALAYLEAQQPGETILVAIGAAAQLVESLAGLSSRPAGLVWIRPDIQLETMPEITPLLDIAPESARHTNEQALARRIFMQQQQEVSYAQRRISGAGYGFYGFEKQVLGYVRGWLARQFVSEAED